MYRELCSPPKPPNASASKGREAMARVQHEANVADWRRRMVSHVDRVDMWVLQAGSTQADREHIDRCCTHFELAMILVSKALF